MKVLAWIIERDRPGDAQGNGVRFFVQYVCGDGTMSSCLSMDADLASSEDQIKAAIRSAVATDTNAKKGSSITADDVRLV